MILTSQEPVCLYASRGIHQQSTIRLEQQHHQHLGDKNSFLLRSPISVATALEPTESRLSMGQLSAAHGAGSWGASPQHRQKPLAARTQLKRLYASVHGFNLAGHATSSPRRMGQARGAPRRSTSRRLRRMSSAHPGPAQRAGQPPCCC